MIEYHIRKISRTCTISKGWKSTKIISFISNLCERYELNHTHLNLDIDLFCSYTFKQGIDGKYVDGNYQDAKFSAANFEFSSGFKNFGKFLSVRL